MLVLTGAEVHFLTIASMEQCFGFVLESVGNTGVFYLSLSNAHRFKAFSALHPTSPVRRLWVHRKVGGDRAATTAHNWPQAFRVFGVCLPKPLPHAVEFCFPGVDSTCLPMGSGECIPCFALLAWAVFTSPVKLSSIATHKTSHFSYSLPHSTTGIVNGWVGLSCWLGLEHIWNWTTAKTCKLKTKKNEGIKMHLKIYS